MTLERESKIYAEGVDRGIQWSIERVGMMERSGEYAGDVSLIAVLSELEKMKKALK